MTKRIITFLGAFVGLILGWVLSAFIVNSYFEPKGISLGSQIDAILFVIPMFVLSSVAPCLMNKRREQGEMNHWVWWGVAVLVLFILVFVAASTFPQRR